MIPSRWASFLPVAIKGLLDSPGLPEGLPIKSMEQQEDGAGDSTCSRLVVFFMALGMIWSSFW